MTDPQATQSQLSFISKMRNASPERDEIFQKFLKEKGKPDAPELTIQEASELIDILSGMKGVDRGDPTDTPATRKQLQFIKNLQGRDKRMDTTSGYLKELKKTDLSELTRKEASTLIDRLKV